MINNNNILTNDKRNDILLSTLMNRGATFFLKAVLVIIAVGVLAALLIFPHFEGRNRNADFFTVYFKDAFLAYVYLTFIPFFGAFVQAFKLLGHIEKNKVFSAAAVRCLRNIKFCAMLFALFFAGILPLIFRFAQDDDAPGVVLIAFVVMFAAFVVATAAGLFQALLQKAVDLKSENDLTV